MPCLGRDACVAEEIGTARTVDEEDLCPWRSEVRVFGPRRHEMSGRDVHVLMARTRGTWSAATGRVATAGQLRITGDRSVGGAVELDPGRPVSGFWQNDDAGLLQLNDSPTCQVSWLEPPP